MNLYSLRTKWTKILYEWVNTNLQENLKGFYLYFEGHLFSCLKIQYDFLCLAYERWTIAPILATTASWFFLALRDDNVQITHCDHESGLSICNQDKNICVQAVVVDPLVQVGRHIHSRRVHKHNVVPQQPALLPRPENVHQLALLQPGVAQGVRQLTHWLETSI